MNAITEWISANPGVTLAMFAGAIFAIGVFEVVHRYRNQIGTVAGGTLQSIESVPQKFEHTFRHVIEVVEGKPNLAGPTGGSGWVDGGSATPGAVMKDAGEKLAAARDAAFGSQAPAKSDAPPSYTSSADGFMWQAYLHDTAPDLEPRAEMIKSFASAFPDKQPAEIVALWRESQHQGIVTKYTTTDPDGATHSVYPRPDAPTGEVLHSLDPLPHVENTNGVLDAFDELVRSGHEEAAYFHMTRRECDELVKRKSAAVDGADVSALVGEIIEQINAWGDLHQRTPPGYVGSAAEALRERA